MPNHIPSGAADIRIGVRLFRCESAMACDGMGEATIYAEKNPLSTRFNRRKPRAWDHSVRPPSGCIILALLTPVLEQYQPDWNREAILG